MVITRILSSIFGHFHKKQRMNRSRILFMSQLPLRGYVISPCCCTDHSRGTCLWCAHVQKATNTYCTRKQLKMIDIFESRAGRPHVLFPSALSASPSRLRLHGRGDGELCMVRGWVCTKTTSMPVFSLKILRRTFSSLIDEDKCYYVGIQA
jgi:hypothetical protein